MQIEHVKVSINLKAGLEVEKTVPSWEANLLEAIHGEGNVVQLGSTVEEGEFDPREIWEALVRKYGTATNDEGKQFVRLVYPNAYALGSYFDRTRPRNVGRPRKQQEEAVAA